MYEYTNPDFEPMVRDYGDSYHQPNAVLSGEGTLVDAVRTIKRKYTNYYDWLDAVGIYNKYINQIIDKYNGKKGIKLAWLLSQFDDYIPVKPKLRKTRQNRRLLREKVTSRPPDIPESTIIKEPINYVDKAEPKIKMMHSKKKSRVYETMISDIEAERGESMSASAISKEMDMISSWYRMSSEKMKNLSKTKRGRRLQTRITRIKRMKIESNYTGLKEIMSEYKENKRNNFYGIDPETENGTTFYKGTILNNNMVEELDTLEELKRLGVKLGRIEHVTAKVVKKKRKENKKHAKALKKERKVMNAITGGDYSDYRTFERDMINMTGIDPDNEV